jgi:hypothetical protein
MASLYPYLTASLPMLNFGMKPPYSFQGFLDYCAQLIPEDDFKVLSTLPRTEEFVKECLCRPVIKKWLCFDTALRNELVKIRASRKHIDAAKYLRRDHCLEVDVMHLALAAHRNPSILEAEKFLDRERWSVLDELATGHYFDLDYLIVYAYKLLILERWERMRLADKEALLENVLQKTSGE